jgi:hypothetical protein
MSTDSVRFAGVVLITVPAIAFGGVRLLRMIFRREPGYLDNPVRQNLWRAGHAHAGVLVILTLVGLLLVDRADLSSGLQWLVRRLAASGEPESPSGWACSAREVPRGAEILLFGKARRRTISQVKQVTKPIRNREAPVAEPHLA